MKTVLYTQRVEIVESYNERRDCADQRIADFIWKCGYLPIPVPNNGDAVEHIIDELEPTGIILTGGNSLLKYGGNAPERDLVDRKLISEACIRKIPLYGFCRGMQSILDYFNVSLVNVTGHVAVRHTVSGLEKDMEVNSYHNQACTSLDNPELVAIMKTEDGVIEKIGHISLPILGTMWHPERENPYRSDDIDMVKELFGGKRN